MNLNSLLKTLLESKIDFVLISGYAAVLQELLALRERLRQK